VLHNGLGLRKMDVMYNGCYGGFSFSTRAMREYRRRKQEAGQEVEPEEPEEREMRDNYGYGREIERHDPIMVQICKDMGSKRVSGPHAKIQLERIPAHYVDHYQIGEYDGMESVVLMKDAYVVHSVTKILANTALSKGEKLAFISAVIKENTDTNEMESA